MDSQGFLMQLIAGVLFVGVSIPLFRLGAKTDRAPERLLGATFLLFGISYILFEISYVHEMLDPAADALEFSGRIALGLGTLALAFFTHFVFRADPRWGTWLVVGSAGLMFGGIAVSAVEGDWAGWSYVGGFGVWLEWLGRMIPPAWLGAEAFAHYMKAMRRMNVGLFDPLVANRFLIWGLFGCMQVVAMFVEVPMQIAYETLRAVPAWIDAAEGLAEFASIGLIWLAYFPPASYRSWITRSAVRGAGAS